MSDRFAAWTRCVLGVILALASRPVGAQSATGPTTRVAVQVRDTSGRAVAETDVLIIRGLHETLASGVTDDRGQVVLTIAASNEDRQLVVRKLGYGREDFFFRATRDSLVLPLVLHRVVAELAPVVVSAEQDLRRKSYHIDADAIANSSAPLFDATDILSKLRPDMICGRSCRPLETVAATTRNPVRKCPTLAFARPRITCPAGDATPVVTTNVWVNGQRIRLIIPSEMALARQHGMLAGLSAGSLTVLTEIKPEHIAEMTYVDEFDHSVGKIGSEGGLFIVLKAGIEYEPGVGSHVLPGALATRPAAPPPAALPAYRLRILGVFDPESGTPIEGADVIDMRTGTRARTTQTGTVSLAFLPEGGTPVRITKEGYEDLTLAVDISADATEPLTVLLWKKKQ